VHGIKSLFYLGYAEVMTPNLFNSELWQLSGHLDKYKENIYMISDELHS